LDILEEEARLFTRYLVNRDVSSKAVQLYKAAMSTSDPDSTDKKLLNFMLAHPRSIGFIDAGLVFHNSVSEARRRLYVMLSILEASTEYYDLFLPKKRSPFYLFVIFYAGLRSVIKAACGLVLIRVIT
jgi:hypothetical protein